MHVSVSGLEFSYPRGSFRLYLEKLFLNSGDRMVLTGPSGCGKSTLLWLLAGIFLPRSGKVLLGNREISNTPDRVRRFFRIQNIGFIFQDFQLIEYLSVMENIRLPYRMDSDLEWNAEVRRRLGNLADRCDIGDKLGVSIQELSHGEKQRVAFCRAILHRPGLILADEPTGNLDSLNRDRIMELLLAEASRNGTTVILATHDPFLLRSFDKKLDLSNPGPDGPWQ